MLRILVILLILLPQQNVFCQLDMDFAKTDKHALKTPRSIENNLPRLVDYLSEKALDDFQKVRGFYVWMTKNIDYDNDAIEPNSKRINHTNQDVLNRKKAVCQGYSNVFKEMCQLSNIRCEVIVGYPKTPREAKPNLNKANHTWNAVLLNKKWYLLDATWGAGNANAYLEDYFLPAPEAFILDHLPNDPMWQLLNCPIDAKVFQKTEKTITNHIQQQKTCFDFQDSIEQFLSLPIQERRLKNARNAYQFNPVEENKSYLGSKYMDKVTYLSDLSYEFEIQDSIETVKALQLEIIETYEIASKYMELFSNQRENLAYTHFNYAVALSREIPELESEKNATAIVESYKRMLHHFETGKSILAEVPPNALSENGLKQFDEYIEYVQSMLEIYQ